MFGIEALYPDRMIESVYSFDWEKAAKKYRGVIFDVDNTLVPHGAAAEQRTVELFERLHRLGIKTMLVSNNGEKRLEPLAKMLSTDYVPKAGKPKKKGYERAIQKLSVGKEKILFVGDQIFTDIWGANRVGLDTILTEPVDASTDEVQIVVKRWLEKPFRRVRNKK